MTELSTTQSPVTEQSNFHTFLSGVDEAVSLYNPESHVQLSNYLDTSQNTLPMGSSSVMQPNTTQSFQNNIYPATVTTSAAEPESMDVDELETGTITQTSSASAHAPEASLDPSGMAGAMPSSSTVVDIVVLVKGMYRILDLVSEEGSGGLGA